MVEKADNRLSEDTARGKIKEILARLSHDQQLVAGAKTATDNSSVDYHIDNIIKAGGGLWNETIAKDYLLGLDAQVVDEKEAPLKMT